MLSKIELEDICVSYGAHTVLKDFSLSVQEGEILGIVGPSGCGKTTVIRAICGFIHPSSGKVKINGKTVFSRKERINVPPERRRIGIVFQDYAVWPHMNVFENVSYPLKKQKVPKKELQERTQEALEQAHMTGYEKYMPSQLSGGQQQRVAIARALTSSEDILIMDEPITNLDAKLREEILVEIRLIQEKLKATVIYITHDQEAAMQLCDRIVIMRQDGSVCQTGTDEEIIKYPADRFVFGFIGVSNFIPIKREDSVFFLHPGVDIPLGRDIPDGFPMDTDHALMAVRPMDIVFDENSPVRGIITQAVFLGSLSNYFVQLGDMELRVQRSSLDSLDGVEYREGQEVGLSFLNERYYKEEP